MRYHYVIRQAVLNNHLMVFSYRSPFVKLQRVMGSIHEVDAKFEKIRLHLFDVKTRSFLYDDLGYPQIQTLYSKSIERSDLLPSTHINHQVSIEKHFKASPFLRYGSYHVKPTFTTGITMIEKIERYLFSESKVVHKNIVSLVKDERVLPVVSRIMRYDIDKATWIEGEDVIHHEYHVERYFKGSIHASLTSEDLIGSGIIDKETWYFEQNLDLARYYRQLKRYDVFKLNRPLKAYFNQMTPKNLGRKAYALLASDNDAFHTHSRALYKGFREPISLYGVDETIDYALFYSMLVSMAILNKQSVLLIDQKRRVIDQQGVLDFTDKEQVNHTIDDALKRLETKVNQVLVPEVDSDSIDLMDEAFFAYETLQMLERFKKRYESQDAFHDVIKLDALIETRKTDVDVSVLNHQAMLKQEDKETQDKVNTLYNRRLKRLKLKAYKRLYDALSVENNEVRYKRLLGLLRNERMLKLMLSVFPLIKVENSLVVAESQHAFDLVVVNRPHDNQLYDFALAGKVMVLDDVNHPSTLFTTLMNRPNNVVKKTWSNGYGWIQNAVIHDVVDEKTAKHVSNAEAEAIHTFFASQRQHVALRTPFNAQRKKLNTLEGFSKAQTIYHKSTKPFTALSLCVQEDTHPKTYDWIKNHPQLKTALKTDGLHLFTNKAAVEKLSDGTDMIYQVLFQAMQKPSVLSELMDFYVNLDRATIRLNYKHYDAAIFDANHALSAVVLLGKRGEKFDSSVRLFVIDLSIERYAIALFKAMQEVSRA